MAEPTSTDKPDADLGPPTAPDSFNVCARGFEDEERANRIGGAVGSAVRQLSCVFDLRRLDGVTVAYDYNQALLELDRGYATSHKLSPSDGLAIGVAMTPSVMRNGTLKCHIVLNAHVMAALESHDVEPENFRLALHVLAHECAHVEVTTKFDEAFPRQLLQQQYIDARMAFRWQVILACWDEYAVTRLSYYIGEVQTDNYEDTFLQHLGDVRQVANGFIRAYRMHGNLDQVFAEVLGAYGDLLKFAAYYLGDLKGHRIAVSERPRTVTALTGHWFGDFFTRLDVACENIAESYGAWTDQACFEVIGDLIEELVAFGGIRLTYTPAGQLYIDIPFTLDTTPYGAKV